MLPLAALAAALAVGIVGIADHSRKSAAIERANVALWFCQHGQGRCADTKPATVEAAWQRRERRYQLALAGTAVVGGWRVRRRQATA